jgi:sodium-coupled neutral amino acid transporter 11
VGFQEATEGNILNSLDTSLPANIARGLLGTTMLFVYPMESFVSRHVCVVLFFQGRDAHEGDDSSVLNRRDRRVTLTFLLYLSAVIPAAFFQNVGIVLAASGAIGGSCLSYIGPGAVYLGIHGARFLELSRDVFGKPKQPTQVSNEEMDPLYSESLSAKAIAIEEPDPWLVSKMKEIVFYLLIMPVWCKIAQIGKSHLTSHITELAMQTPHPIRIGNVRFAPAKIRGGSTRVVMLPSQGAASAGHDSSDFPITTTLIRADSLPKGLNLVRSQGGMIVALPPTPNESLLPHTGMDLYKNYQSINQKVGAMAVRRAKEEEFVLEDDPQQIPPGAADFAIAIFYILFGVMAMLAGLYSIYEEVED